MKAINDSLVILNLYVDDMLLTSRHSYELDAIWAKLHEAFDMKHLGDARHILDICIMHDKK